LIQRAREMVKLRLSSDKMAAAIAALRGP